MNNELKLHIKKLQKRAILSEVAILLIVLSVIFGIPLLIVYSLDAIGFFVIPIIGIVYLIYSNHIVKKELRESKCKPVIFEANSNFTFKEVVTIFENLTDKENKISISDDVLFFHLNKIFKLRIVLYRTVDFDKKAFNKAKERINKKANKKLNISHWVNRYDATKMMRFNIIYTETLNAALYQLLSQNANHNLSRVEGIINIAIIGNQIIIQPIYGGCDSSELNRYKNIIKFINQVLLSK